LAQAGLTVVGAEVGELITSLDMAGCSLTLCWLDDELARLWAAPADSAAYRKGVGPAAVPTSTVLSDDDADLVVGPASGDARRAAARAVDVLRAMADALHANEDALGRLDAVAGDGDHGRGMTRGCDAALAAASRAVAAGAGVRTAIVAASMAWGDRAGGTSGALWSAGLLAFGRELGDDRETTAKDVGRAVNAALGIVGHLGGALPGDKTLVDALHPFAETLSADLASGADLRSAWTNAAAIAQAAADATAALRPRLGRARPLAERSIGSPDPGAVSLALCLRSSAPLV
jgi:dihydroxyacetone kinase